MAGSLYQSLGDRVRLRFWRHTCCSNCHPQGTLHWRSDCVPDLGTRHQCDDIRGARTLARPSNGRALRHHGNSSRGFGRLDRGRARCSGHRRP